VTLDEWAGKGLLARFGLPHPGGRRVPDPATAVAAAEGLGYPVAVKAVGRALAHKSELGAVALALWDAASVEAAARRMAGLGDALLVEPMVEDGVAELILGVSRDPQLGLCLVVGAGGVLVELLDDRALHLLPTTAEKVRAALLKLCVAPLLQGFRGRPAGDVDAAVAAALAVAQFAQAHAGRLAELDVNPLIVRPAGKGAVAADVLVRLVPES
jgi:acetate---CoA ligase (ADP-forming)